MAMKRTPVWGNQQKQATEINQVESNPSFFVVFNF
jgi:hypothetical protein